MTIVSPVEVKKEKAASLEEATENQNEVEEIDESVVITNEKVTDKDSSKKEKIVSSKKVKKNKKLGKKKVNTEENVEAVKDNQNAGSKSEKFIGKKRKRSLNESTSSTPVVKKKSKMDNAHEKLKAFQKKKFNSLKNKKRRLGKG